MSKEYDPFMHTAEHVLNQTMVKKFHCQRSFSSHLNSKKSKCDYAFSRPLTQQEAQEIEAAVNAVLAKCLPVTEETLPRCEAALLVDLSRLPESVAANAPIRLVRVGEFDICPCIGEHVANTCEVGQFRLTSHSFTPAGTGFDHGVLRLRFALQAAAN